jgi:hypothetical protein
VSKYSDSKDRADTNKLKKQVRELLSENRRLKSEINTLMEAWHKTEIYLKDITRNKTLSEVVKNVKTNNKMREERCPECGSQDIKTIKLKHKVIKTCKVCNYRDVRSSGYEEEK